MASVVGEETTPTIKVVNDLSEYWAGVSNNYAQLSGSYANNAATSATLAANWANFTEDTVDGNEYSAKYYAGQAQTIVSSATGLIEETVSDGIAEIGSVILGGTTTIGDLTTIAVSTITTLRTQAVDTISVTASTTIEATEAACNSLVSAATSATDDIKTSVVSATTSETEAIGVSVISATTTATEAIGVSVVSATTAATDGIVVDAVGSVNDAKTTALITIGGLKTESLSVINATTEAAKTTITDLKTDALNTIGALYTEAFNTITTLTTEATTLINNGINTITTLTTIGTTTLEALTTQGVNTINATKTAYIAEMTTLKNQTTTARDEALIWAEGTDEQVQALGGTHSAKDWCLYNSTVNQNDVRALEGGLNQGEVYTKGDSDSIDSRLSEIKSIAHSTFDRSKFPVEGSPNITDDGIVSGFSSSNYIKVFANIPIGSKWKIRLPLNTGTERASGSQIPLMVADKDSGSAKIKVELNAAGYLYFQFYHLVDGTQTYLAGWNTPSPIPLNTKDVYEIEFTGSNYNIYKNKSLIKTLDVNTTIDSNDLLFTPCTTTFGTYGCKYPQDLKQFSITVDGVEVFSGNRTGIDTIKPDDYTVVGTPTISADGIISGFTASNYITKTITDLDYSKDFDFISPVATLASNSSQKWFILDGNGGFRISQHVAQVKFSFKLNTDTTLTNYNVLSGLAVGDKIQGRVKKVGTNLYLYARKNDGDWVGYANNPIANVTTLNANNVINIGWSGAGDAYCWDGSVDLNTYKVFAQGDLVYQPCLKIPYTESKTGSKIVDSTYRDRVNDMASQFGYANYYTLDEDNGNFTLPQVELYGLINKKTDRPDYTSKVTTSDVNGSSNAYTVSQNCVAIVKPSTPASTYTISVNGNTVNAYGYMTLELNVGDKVYTNTSATMEIYRKV